MTALRLAPLSSEKTHTIPPSSPKTGFAIRGVHRSLNLELIAKGFKVSLAQLFSRL
jgi:hypothetical protein